MNLFRVRWAVRGVLFLGVAASVTANILHAPDNIISQAISAWSPLALLLTVELISRIPVGSRLLAAARLLATAAIAGIAAWVSYWHMVSVATKYGETGAAPYLLPLSVDGLIVVASICLVELGQRLAMATSKATGHELARPGGLLDGQAVAISDEDMTTLATEFGQAVADGRGQAVASDFLATSFVASDGQPVDHPYVAELNDYERKMDMAIGQLGQEVASEAEAFLAKVPPGMPLPRRRPATTPGVPAEARELLLAWEPAALPGKDVDQLLAAHFAVSERTARRWRSTTLGPASGPPSI